MSSDKEHPHSILHEVKVSKVILPTILGVGVVLWLMYTQLEIHQLENIQSNASTLFWITAACLVYVVRHLFYAWRLRLLSGYYFSWWKAIELIVIWEFSSAVSPTSVGGSGVAFFFLSQEKLSGGKTVSLVLYSIVLDTFFFLLSLPLFYLIFGPKVIRPDMAAFADLDGYGWTFLLSLLGMAVYGSLFYYGVFINPRIVKRFLLLLSKIPLWKKMKDNLRKTAMDVVVASSDLKHQSVLFHMQAIVATAGAWITRFVAINFLIMALVNNLSLSWYDQGLLLGRGEVMHVITTFSPTPGGAGIAEYLFGGFYSDYIPAGIASIIALVWRLVTYYPYLLAGAIVIPIWIKKLLEHRHDTHTVS